MNYIARPQDPGFISLKQELEQTYGVNYGVSNWDQEGGVTWKHAETASNAFIKWVCNYAPEFEQYAALRHGIRPVPEDALQAIDGSKFVDTVDGKRISNWPQILSHPELRGVAEFSLTSYKELLYEPDGVTPRISGGIQHDYEDKIQNLFSNIFKFYQERL